MIHAYKSSTLTELHDSLTRRLVEAKEEELDIVTSVDVQLHNAVCYAESLEWEFNFKDLWLTPSRWTMMIRQYLDGDSVAAWVEKIVDRVGTNGRGIAVLRTKEVQGRGGDITGHTNKASRRWGSCMLTLSYKAKPHPTIVMHSRTSYLGYIAALDLTVAWTLARYLAWYIDCEVEDIAFVWYNEALQFHNFKSLAYLLNHPDEDRADRYRHLMLTPELGKKEQRFIESRPGLHLSRKWMEKVIREDEEGVMYGEMSYNTYRRIRRRYHTEVHGYDYALQFVDGDQGNQRAYKPLPDTFAEGCNLAKIGLPTPWSK